MNVEIIRELPDWRGDAVLVRRDDGRFFVVSTVIPFDTGKMETLAFAANADADCDNWEGIAGGIGKTREQTIAQLADDELANTLDEWVEEMGGPVQGFAGAAMLMRDDFLGLPVSERPT